MSEFSQTTQQRSTTDNIEAIFNDPRSDPSGLAPNLATSQATVTSLLGNEEEPGVPSRANLVPDPKTHKLSAAAYPNSYPLSPDTPEASVHHSSSDADPIPTASHFSAPEAKILPPSFNNTQNNSHHHSKMSESTHPEPTHAPNSSSQPPSSVNQPHIPSRPAKSQDSILSILGWKDPIRSGTVYGLLLFGLLLVKKINFLRLSLFVISVVLGVATTAEYVSKLAGFKNGILSTVRPQYKVTVSKAKVEHLVPQIVDNLNCAMSLAQKIIFVDNVSISATVFGAAFVLYHLTRLLSLWYVAFITVNTAFVVTPVYFTYQKEIDTQIEHVTGVVKDHSAKLHETVSAQVSPYISQASEKNPVQTKEE